jgi:hypothetical protein
MAHPPWQCFTFTIKGKASQEERPRSPATSRYAALACGRLLNVCHLFSGLRSGSKIVNSKQLLKKSSFAVIARRSPWQSDIIVNRKILLCEIKIEKFKGIRLLPVRLWPLYRGM